MRLPDFSSTSGSCKGRTVGGDIRLACPSACNTAVLGLLCKMLLTTEVHYPATKQPCANPRIPWFFNL